MTASGSVWRDRRRAAVSVTFDNLGEAAELELGLEAGDQPPEGHYSVATALPIVLEELERADLRATFFVEGLNAELYPEALRRIASAGHEVAYHAWRHEDWSAIDPAQERENLQRGLDAMRAIGLDPAGFRPPGGLLNEGTGELLAGAGLRYCSPAGTRAGIDGVVVLPFAWPAVDAYHVLPTFASLRRHIGGSEEAGGANAVRTSLLAAIEDAVEHGEYVSLVLHTWMVEMEREAVRDVLARVAGGVAQGELWAARCDEVSDWVASHAGDFAGGPRLDRTSWMEPA
jgi:peptidoglycan/xylan/chitin deacetylase (PgdA/CDA1 family)